ncbi:phosphotransferase [Polycladomyces subterraneus]|uniref:Phosphotransferase n=1 Tax=Polycladomyces subterraneus TaxID=1016997 RepID=A0ABT8IIB6_9BACL|nr:phosphotransferase [Polycladomyces subterraneus]MDN4592492.1 phosphotransferase [Polycladomyces subterraneus]
MAIQLPEERAVLEQVFERYGWVPLQVRPVSGILRIQTADGAFALKKSSCSAEQLTWLHKVMEAVQSKSQEIFLPWLKTSDGEAYVQTEDAVWYATPWVENDPGLRETIPIEGLPTMLAHVHRSAFPVVGKQSERKQSVNVERLQGWKDKLGKLAEYREVIESRTFRSPFDHAFAADAEYVDQALRFAVKGMEKFVQSDKGIAPRYTLCHGRIHPSNLLKKEDGWVWIDWDHAAVDSPVRDLGAFFRRFSQQLDHEKEPQFYLARYEEGWKLSGKEKKLLALYLAYPERPLRLLTRYYEMPDRIEETIAIRRWEEEITHLRWLQSLIRSLWLSKKGSGSKTRKTEAVRIRSQKR